VPLIQVSRTWASSSTWAAPQALAAPPQVYSTGESGAGSAGVSGTHGGASGGGGALGGEPALGGVIPGSTVLTITIGPGGTGTATAVTGGSVTVTGNFGQSASGAIGGPGGAPGSNALAEAGGAGANGAAGTRGGSGGGGSAGAGGPGGAGNAASGTTAGLGGTAGPGTPAGAAGSNGGSVLSAGLNGIAPGSGAGGGGSGGSPGGTGAPGQVVIVWLLQVPGPQMPVGQGRPRHRRPAWMRGHPGSPVFVPAPGPAVAPPPPAAGPVRQHRPGRHSPWMRGETGTPVTGLLPGPAVPAPAPAPGPVRQKRPARRSPRMGGQPGAWTTSPQTVVNQWAATFAQPAAFGNMPPALQSVVVPLNSGNSVGGGTGTSTPGNWLFCIVGWNQADALPSVDFGDGDDIHSYWRPGGASGAGGATGTSIWYTPNIARQVNDVYVAPNGATAGVGVLVLEVAGLGPWDTVTGVFANFADLATSLNLALPAPSASACLIAAVTGDSTAAGQAFTPPGWTTLSTVTASNGSDHSCDVVLTSAILPATAGPVSVTATASSADLSGVIIGVLTNAPSPIPAGSNAAWPLLKCEFAPGGGFETPPDQLQWVDITKRLWSWHESTGPQYQLAQMMSTAGTMQVDNFDGSLSPSNPGGLWYSNALNVNMSFNAPFPHTGVKPWTGINGATLAQSSTYAFASAPNAAATYSCEVTPDGSTALPGARSEMDPVTAGSVYSASAWFLSPAGWSTGAQAAIRWYDSSSVPISTSAVAATSIPAGTTVFTQVTQLAVTAPAGAAYASVVARFAGTPAVPFWLAEACIVPGSLPPVTGRVTTGTPIRLRCALGTMGGVAYNRWYVTSRNALSWPEKRNKAMRNFVDATFSDLWSVVSKSSPTPYRGEVEQDAPYAWWPLDDQLLTGSVLPVAMRNAAVGNANVLSIALSPAGAMDSASYSTAGLYNTYQANSVALYTVNALQGLIYGDPQSGLQSSAGSGGAVTAQPGSAAWQQAGMIGGTGSQGWYLACQDANYPSVASGVTIEGWWDYGWFGGLAGGGYRPGNAITGTTYIQDTAQQPYCPLTLFTITSSSAMVAMLQLDLTGDLNLIVMESGSPTSFSIYTATDLRTSSWHHYALALTTSGYTVYVDGGQTAQVSGSLSGVAASFTWVVINGDMGSNAASDTSAYQHGGNVAISHFAIYPAVLPAYRIWSHYNAAVTGFGQIPAPSGVTAEFVTGAIGWAADGTPVGSGTTPYGYYGGAWSGGAAPPPNAIALSVIVTAQLGAYTSGPSAWTVITGYSSTQSAYVGWTGFAPLFTIYTGAALGGELEAATVCGPADTFYGGYGSSAAGAGPAQVAGGTGASPPTAASSLGDTVGQRLERLLGYGNVTSPRRCIDPAPELVRAALDIGGQQSGSSVGNIVQSDDGFLFIDLPGNISYRQRPHLAADQVVWFIGMNVAGGMLPFSDDVEFGNDPARVWDDITVASYAPDGSSPPVLTPTSAVLVNAAQQQYGDRPQQVTSYLQDPAKQQAQADWIFATYGSLQRRVAKITIEAASHPASWAFVLSANISDLIQVFDQPFGAPATTGIYRISHLDRTVSYSANGSEVTGRAEVTADPVPASYWS
jgi:hypothetical protein